jgi:hypothetical protein
VHSGYLIGAALGALAVCGLIYWLVRGALALAKAQSITGAVSALVITAVASVVVSAFGHAGEPHGVEAWAIGSVFYVGAAAVWFGADLAIIRRKQAAQSPRR